MGDKEENRNSCFEHFLINEMVWKNTNKKRIRQQIVKDEK